MRQNHKTQNTKQNHKTHNTKTFVKTETQNSQHKHIHENKITKPQHKQINDGRITKHTTRIIQRLTQTQSSKAATCNS